MGTNFKFWLGTMIAYVLVILYAGAVVIMMFFPDVVRSTGQANAAPQVAGAEEGVAGIETITTWVGGLISAFIISVLAVTPKSENVLMTLKGPAPKEYYKTTAICLYIVIWLITGVAALVWGTALGRVGAPFLTTVSDLGAAWLATAVASGYAYFGINPQGA